MSRYLKKWSNSAHKLGLRVRQALDPRPGPDKCIIVASNGRSGSTLTWQAIQEAMMARDLSTRKKCKFVPRLADVDFSAPSLYKTHDFPDALTTQPDNTRVVFCFGSTKDSALSVYSAMDRFGADWVEQHFYHLHATGTFDELFQKDVLQQARQIREWATFEGVPVLCIHYDAIWDHKAEISEFIGLEFKPPERKKRLPKQIPDMVRAAADDVYDPIDEIVDKLPKVFLASKQYSGLVRELPE